MYDDSLAPSSRLRAKHNQTSVLIYASRSFRRPLAPSHLDSTLARLQQQQRGQVFAAAGKIDAFAQLRIRVEQIIGCLEKTVARCLLCAVVLLVFYISCQAKPLTKPKANEKVVLDVSACFGTLLI